MLLCQGREEEYPEFMRRRGVPLGEEQDDLGGSTMAKTDLKEEAERLREKLRKSILRDRDLHDKGTKAYVSFVRSYSKHEASYIFNLASYDLVGLARCFALLKLPKMPELKNAKSLEDWTDAQVDVSHSLCGKTSPLYARAQVILR